MQEKANKQTNSKHSFPAEDSNKILLNNYYCVTVIKLKITKYFWQVVLVAKVGKHRVYL